MISKHFKTGMQGKTMTLSLKNLRGNDNEIVAAGSWEISFPLDYRIDFPERTASSEVNIYGYNMQAELYLSPMSLELVFTGDVPENPPGQWFGLDNVTLNYTDGTSEPADFLGFSANYERDKWESDWSFRKLIDPKKVKSITYLDCEIPLE